MTRAADYYRRNRLARLLAVASRLEHALTCQYLFAAFSMKRTVAEGGVTYHQLERMRNWEAELLLIARQEMEHLGLTFNLRTAIGEAPSFEVAPFPFRETVEDIPLDHDLQPFCFHIMLGFADMEMPDRLQKTSPYYSFLAKEVPEFAPDRVDAIARLYAEIHGLMKDLPEEILFIGPQGAQLDTPDIFPGAIRGLNLGNGPAYQVQLNKVSNRDTALQVIDQITTEGEGTHDEGGAGSHFARVMDILIELNQLQNADPDFAPSRAVVPNPSLDGAANSTMVRHPFARDVMTLFELAYETMLLALSRFFAFPPDDRDEMFALQQVAFFPMMTTIIRPLGELLTLLPSGTGPGLRAGASFRSPGPVEAPPHRTSTYRMLELRYQQMAGLANDLTERVAEAEVDSAAASAMHDRLQFLAEQIERSAINLSADYWRKPSGF